MHIKKNHEFNWQENEVDSLKNRILNLRPDQVAALLNLSGLNFATKDIENVLKEIFENKNQSGHLEILIYEAESKEDLLFCINFFEKHK